MDQLQNARARIDLIDQEMAALFCARMDAVREVIAYKQAQGLPVLDAAREEEVAQKNIARLPDASYLAFYDDFIRHTMALSRQYQAQLAGRGTVAYQGVEGAFSHIVLRRLFPHVSEQAYATWAEVVKAVETGAAAYGVLPFENSYAGDVSEVLDLCFTHPDICVRAMVDLPVSQNLLGVPGAALADVREVYSHAQALSQSARFLKSMGLAGKPYPNTAAAAKYVAETADKSKAAIASAETAALYGLTVLASDVNTSHDNATRFIVIGKELPAHGDGFSLLFTVDHRAGQLAAVIQTVGEMGFNLECIKSRPMPHIQWQYYFYIEIVGNFSQHTSQELCTRLADVCKTIRVLGVYNKGKV